jgi:predicted DNA-binding transcriptional regulator YafY
MRHDKATRLLDLARTLAGSSEGLTLDEMARAMGVGRRTAERMRDAVWAAFPQMEAIEDPPTRRFRIPSGLDSLFQTPTAEELAALRTAAARPSAPPAA